jgi:hypothetical protein
VTATAQPASDVRPIEKVASGQKLIIYAILVNLLTIGLMAVFGDIAGLVAGSKFKSDKGAARGRLQSGVARRAALTYTRPAQRGR